MNTRQRMRRRKELAQNPGLDPDMRFFVNEVNEYLTDGWPTTTTTSTTSSTSSTTSSTTTTA